ncbi:hypothetical protein HPP92_012919 [Vanilla planifolia]|uniref:Uncharacterized protein n=1 Tax=Vanilla planifolia TaxID=51239 RepID=A0A835QY18_VANPL|nr:hypothetical protein HPP92_012919 [Vanilla planifolia]
MEEDVLVMDAVSESGPGSMPGRSRHPLELISSSSSSSSSPSTLCQQPRAYFFKTESAAPGTVEFADLVPTASSRTGRKNCAVGFALRSRNRSVANKFQPLDRVSTAIVTSESFHRRRWVHRRRILELMFPVLLKRDHKEYGNQQEGKKQCSAARTADVVAGAILLMAALRS